MIRKKKCPAFTGVAADATATSNLTLGRRYHSIELEIGYDAVNTAKPISSVVGEIRVLVNGVAVRTHTYDELDGLNTRLGTEYAAVITGTVNAAGYRARVPIFFSEPSRKGNTLNKDGSTTPESELTAWNAAGIRSLSVEVDIKGGVVSPVVKGVCQVDPLTSETLGSIVKIERLQFAVAGTEQDITTIDRSGHIAAIRLMNTSDAKSVTKCRVTANDEIVHEDFTFDDNSTTLKRAGMNPPASGAYDIEFDHDDRLTNALAAGGLKELTVRPTFSAAASGNMVALVHRIAPVLG